MRRKEEFGRLGLTGRDSVGGIFVGSDAEWHLVVSNSHVLGQYEQGAREEEGGETEEEELVLIHLTGRADGC